MKLLKLFVCFLLCSMLFSSPLLAETDGGQSIEDEIWDPIEPVNRGIFWFNEQFDQYFFQHVAEGYDYITPDIVQDGVNNFLDNLFNPAAIVSSLFQFKMGQTLEQTGRFLVNSTFGLAGFLDVAQHVGLEEEKEDVGTLLAYWGVPAGPYLVIPFIGPSNLRDGIGFVADGYLSPAYMIGHIDGVSWEDQIVISYAVGGTAALQKRTNLLDAVEAGRESSTDFYLFTQATYYQYRRNLLNDDNLEEDRDLLDDDWEFED